MDAIQIKPEIRLIAILSTPRLTDQHKLNAARILNRGIDFSVFKKLLQRHRVFPSVYTNVRDHFRLCFPEQLVSDLARQYRNNIKRNKLFLKTLLPILNSLKLADIPVAPVKGVFLTQTLYGDIAKRHFNDIDLLIHRSDIIKANNSLNKLGFYCEIFSDFPTYLVFEILKKQKDLIYINKIGIILELHVRLANVPTDLAASFGKLLFTCPFQTVWYRPEAFLYLCWHGMNTFFHRIKWLSDLAILINTMDMDWEQMYRTAYRLDCLRVLTVSLVLSHIVFDTRLPKQAAEYYSRDRVCRWLFTIAINNINFKALSSSIYTKSVLTYLLLPKSWKNKIGGMAFLIRPGYNDFKMAPVLPKTISGFYYLFRPFVFLWRRVRYMQKLLFTPSK